MDASWPVERRVKISSLQALHFYGSATLVREEIGRLDNEVVDIWARRYLDICALVFHLGAEIDWIAVPGVSQVGAGGGRGRIDARDPF